jgi:hypothetical protein
MKKLLTILLSAGFALSVVAAPIILNIGGKIISISPPSDLPVLYSIPTNAIITVTVPGLTNYQVSYWYLYTNLLNSVTTNITIIESTNPVAASNVYSGGTLPTGVLTAGGTNLAGHLLVVGNGVRYNTDNGGVLTNVNAASLGNVAAGSFYGVPHLGFVGGDTRVNFTQISVGSPTDEWMQRSHHLALCQFTNAQVYFANFKYDETGPASPTLVRATIEYPTNVFTRLTFGGSTNGIIPIGTFLASDMSSNFPVTIPEGAMFWVRAWYSNSVGFVYSTYENHTAANAGFYDYAAYGTTVPDQTGGGGMSFMTAIYCPLAIVGLTPYPNVIIQGDSRAAGVGEISIPNGSDGVFDPSMSYGYSRIFDAQHLSTLNLGSPGETLSHFLTTTNRLFFSTNFTSTTVCAYGINDINTGATASGLENLVSNLCGIVYPNPVVATTLEPWTTSVDLWTSLSGQTPAVSQLNRTNYNNALRYGLIPGVRLCLDLASFVESSYNSGLWSVNGTTNFLTQDGIHPYTTACKLYASETPNPFSSANHAYYLPVYNGSFNGSGSGLTNNNAAISSLSFNSLVNSNQTATIAGVAEADDLVINTNFLSGFVYTNSYGGVIGVSASVSFTTAAVAGMSQLSLRAIGSATNYASALSAITGGLTGTYTNGTLSIYVPANALFTFTNTSSGSGDSTAPVGGQILVY